MDETLFDWIFILGILNILCCGALLVISFIKPKPEEEFKPVEFDWKQEGF